MKCKLVLQGMTTEEVWAFCRCLPEGVSLPTIWFERCRIHDKSPGQMPDDREPNALAYLASHTGLRGVCFRGGILGNQALTHLADGAEQRKQQGDRGLQVLCFDLKRAIGYSNEVVGGGGMARLIASSPHLEKLTISGFHHSRSRRECIDLLEVIGALGGLKDLQTLVIKHLWSGDLCNKSVATQWRELAKNPPPIATIVLDGWHLDRGVFSATDSIAAILGFMTRSDVWGYDALKALCEVVARIPGCVTVQVGRIGDNLDRDIMRTLGEALNSRKEPFNLHMTTRDYRSIADESGFLDGLGKRASMSTQTELLEKLSGSAQLHSLQVGLSPDELLEDCKPVRAITAVLNRIGGLQRLVLDISDYEGSRRDGSDVPSAHLDARSDLLVAIDAHPSLSSLVLPAELYPEEDPDWKRLILAKRIREIMRHVPIDNLQGEVPGPLMGEQDPSPVVHRRWADQIRAQLNQKNHNL